MQVIYSLSIWMIVVLASSIAYAQENPFEAVEEKMNFFMEFMHGYFSRTVIIVAIIAVGVHWMFTKRLNPKEDGMILVGAIVVATAAKVATWLLEG